MKNVKKQKQLKVSEIIDTNPVSEPAKLLKLDLGCGPNKRKEDNVVWTGVDVMKFDGVDVVLDLVARDLTKASYTDNDAKMNFKKWPWADNSVEEVHSSHFVEHLEPYERIHFVNEIYRVLRPGGKALLIAPNWNSTRAYGDLTHKWPPVSDFWFNYLSSEWRKANAPHNTEYNCNFGATWGFSIRQDVLAKNQEYQMFAMQNFTGVCEDVLVTLHKQ